MRSYLPTCQTDELAQIFGPIDAWFCEAEPASALVEHRRAGARLLTQVPGAAASAAAAP